MFGDNLEIHFDRFYATDLLNYEKAEQNKMANC